MGERKVQAKYYPPDFDPSKLPRIQKKKQNDDAVRFMLPMSVRCETCGEFMGTGLKFNARKSDTNQNYLGIRIFRFTMKCKGCPSSFGICTDPQNSDYKCDFGVRRNYEPWREAQNAEREAKDERARQDEDAVQALENRTLDAKAQMDDLDDLQALMTENAKRAKLGTDHLLKSRLKNREHNLQTEDDILDAQAELLLERKRLASTLLPTDSSNEQSSPKRAKSGSPLSKASIIQKPRVLTNVRVIVKKKTIPSSASRIGAIPNQKMEGNGSISLDEHVEIPSSVPGSKPKEYRDIADAKPCPSPPAQKAAPVALVGYPSDSDSE